MCITHMKQISIGRYCSDSELLRRKKYKMKQNETEYQHSENDALKESLCILQFHSNFQKLIFIISRRFSIHHFVGLVS